MRAIEITAENLPQLKTEFAFAIEPIIKIDESLGRYIDGYLDESEDIIGKILIKNWANRPRGWGIVTKEVFIANFRNLYSDKIIQEDMTDWFVVADA